MMDWNAFAVIFPATVMAALIPGQDFFYIASNTLAGGRTRGLVAVAGIFSGLVIYVLAVACGLGAVFRAWPGLIHAVRALGVAYLLWLAFSLGRAAWRHDGLMSGAPAPAGSMALARVYAGGIMMNLLNPKTAIYFVSFLPQFIDGSRGDAAAQLMALGFPAILTGCSVYAAEVLLIARAGPRILSSPRLVRSLYAALSALFLAVAAGLAIARF